MKNPKSNKQRAEAMAETIIEQWLVESRGLPQRISYDLVKAKIAKAVEQLLEEKS